MRRIISCLQHDWELFWAIPMRGKLCVLAQNLLIYGMLFTFWYAAFQAVSLLIFSLLSIIGLLNIWTYANADYVVTCPNLSIAACLMFIVQTAIVLYSTVHVYGWILGLGLPTAFLFVAHWINIEDRRYTEITRPIHLKYGLEKLYEQPI